MYKLAILVALTSISNQLKFELPKPTGNNLLEYRECLFIFYKSQPVWSWVVLHEEDHNQPFYDILNAIYEVGVPLYNYDESKVAKDTGYFWFQNNLNISSISRESKVFIMSRSKFHINLMNYGKQSFRRGDKILYSNYLKGSRISFQNVVTLFGVKNSLEGLTRYNLLPITTFLFITDDGGVDPVSYMPTNRKDLFSADTLHLECNKLYSNSIDKLIFDKEYFTIAAFESVHALHQEDDYYGRDAIIGKILVESTKFRYEYLTPKDGATYGDEKNYSGVYKAVVKGVAQMALNSRFFITKIITDNVVEYTYPYNRDDLVILIPVQLSTSQLFYFTYYSYGISMVTIISLYFYFKMMKRRRSIVEVIILFFLVCSGRPIKETKIKFFRTIYMAMMVVSFYGYTLFNIQILSTLTLKPSELSVKSVKEFASTNYKIYSGTTVKAVLEESLQFDELAPKILPRIQTPLQENETMLEEKRVLVNCSEYAVICSRSTALYYKHLNNIQSKQFCYNIVPEAIVPSLTMYILGYRSPFQTKFNELLSRIIENGLVANYSGISAEQHIQAISDEIRPFGMQNNRERMPWVVYIIGICVGFGVFIVEVFVWPYIYIVR